MCVVLLMQDVESGHTALCLQAEEGTRMHRGTVMNVLQRLTQTEQLMSHSLFCIFLF